MIYINTEAGVAHWGGKKTIFDIVLQWPQTVQNIYKCDKIRRISLLGLARPHAAERKPASLQSTTAKRYNHVMSLNPKEQKKVRNIKFYRNGNNYFEGISIEFEITRNNIHLRYNKNLLKITYILYYIIT